MLEKTLESPLDSKEIKPVSPKGINPEYSLEGPMLKLMQRVDSLEKTLMLGYVEGRRRRGQQRMRWLDGITASMDIQFSSVAVMSNLWDRSCLSLEVPECYFLRILLVKAQIQRLGQTIS